MDKKPNASPFPTTERMEREKACGTFQHGLASAVETRVDEVAIDNGVEESFPASDPVSVSITKIIKPAD